MTAATDSHNNGQPTPRVSGARELATEALTNPRLGRYVQRRLDRLIAERRPIPADGALATELALGTVRHQLTLDHIIARFLHGRLKNVAPDLLAVLRIGVYQLIWLKRIPDFAVVDSAVDQAKRRHGRRAGGLTNALLRKILRHRREQTATVAPDTPRRAIRINMAEWREFDEDVLPEPAQNFAAYLSAATSHPHGLIDRWLKRFGPADTERICLAGSLRPPLILRANVLRVDPESLVELLAREGVTAVHHKPSGAVFIADAPHSRVIRAVASGLCQPQDVTAQAVVRVRPPRPGARVLDLCAAPGTKTVQLAECMNDEGVILACDRTQAKLALIADSCRRMGVTCVTTALSEQLGLAAKDCGPFDMALVDAPCSNSGVLSRRPEARYRITARTLSELANKQTKLLTAAAEYVRPGGKIIYSTCSIEPVENEKVIQRFLTGVSGWRLLDSKLTLPCAGGHLTDWRDGGFCAVMVRT
jgi:16S rRNA (cytosine967-C5)-methyltransferase